jgi:hypothetical protein
MTTPRFYLIIVMTILIPTLNLFGQIDSTKFKNFKHPFEYQRGDHPICIIKFNSSTVQVDTSILRKIDPIWIRNINILRYGKNSVLRDPPSYEPIIFINIKHRYLNRFKQYLKDNKYVT